MMVTMENGKWSVHARTIACSSSTNKWNHLGNTLVGAASYDDFGKSVSMPADGMTVALGTPENSDNGTHDGGHTTLFARSSTANRWNQLGSTLLGTKSHNFFWIFSLNVCWLHDFRCRCTW